MFLLCTYIDDAVCVAYFVKVLHNVCNYCVRVLHMLAFTVYTYVRMYVHT